MTDFVAYHDRTGRITRTISTPFIPLGYRMISLSVYQPADPLYAAVWVRRPGPDWSAVHGLDGAGYQAAFDIAAAAGFHPIILSVAGSPADRRSSRACSSSGRAVPLTRFGLCLAAATPIPARSSIGTGGPRERLADDRRRGLRQSADPAYAGIWPPTIAGCRGARPGILDQRLEYQQRFDAQVSGWARPAHVAVSQDERYLSIFVDDQIGPWIARHGLTSAAVPGGVRPPCAAGLLPDLRSGRRERRRHPLRR